MDLSKKERLILRNQLKILEELEPEEAEYYRKTRKAIEKGFSLHYEPKVLLYEEMSEEECREVINILNMYRALTFSYKNLDDKSEIEEVKIEFPGFDGNNETKQLAYAEYFMNDLDRFAELRDDSDYPDYNSHSRRLEQYRRMLNEWNAIGNKHELSKEEIIRLINA